MSDVNELVEKWETFKEQNPNDICSIPEFKSLLDNTIAILQKHAYPKREKLLPCLCGCKKRGHWYGYNGAAKVTLKCMKCGFSVSGSSENNAVENWNKAIKKEMRT